MILVTEEQVRRHVTIEAMIGAVEAAFRALDRGEAKNFPVLRGTGSDPTTAIGIKAGRDGAVGMIGVKAGTYNPRNRLRGLDTHGSTTILLDDETSALVAVVQANYLNGMRTAAADALAVRELARRDARTVGLIGTGSQALFEVEAIRTVRPIRHLLAAPRSEQAGEDFARRVRARTGLEVEIASVERTVRRADILVTTTPSTTPLFEVEWVQPGTHISAMGADNVGKMELPIALVDKARLFVDDPSQAAMIGEAQHVVNAGLRSVADLAERTLGALLNGRVAGRQDEMAITIFDSSGIAIQDIAAARVAIDLVGAAQ